jgi:hypothetical protein
MKAWPPTTITSIDASQVSLPAEKTIEECGEQ